MTIKKNQSSSDPSSPTPLPPQWQSASLIGLQDLARTLPSGLAVLASRGTWKTAKHLNLLTEKLVALEQRRITRLLVETPPRHGKSELCSQYLPAWYLGRHPDHRVILASYESGFAGLHGERARDILAEYGPSIFGIGIDPNFGSRNNWRIHKPGLQRPGGMLSVGMTGGVTGRGANLLIIDDPIKDAIEASSETYRERAWNWYTATTRSRLEPGAVMIVIQTRWHEDDLIGRLRRSALTGGEQWDSLTLPALAGVDDPLGRTEGQALWPWRYDEAALQAIKDTIPEHWWNALYQQRPTPPGGSLAKAVWFKPIDGLPSKRLRWMRFWDVASTEKKPGADPDWTVGVLMARDGDNFFIVDVIRVQESSGVVDTLIKQTAVRDGKHVLIREEEEGGSSGIAVINNRKAKLLGWNYQGVKPRGEKAVRWVPMLSAAELGLMYMRTAEWNPRFIQEICAAPYGRHDDQLDACSGAFNCLTENDAKARPGIF